MRIRCNQCRAEIDAQHVDLSRNIAKCTQCGEIFNCSDQLSSIASSSTGLKSRPDIFIPKNCSIGYEQGGLVITRRWAGPHVFALLLFCIFWDGFMIVWYTIAITQKDLPMAAFGSLHALIGIVLTYSVVAGFINRTIITAAPGMLKIRHVPLPAFGGKKIASAEILQLYTKEKNWHGQGCPCFCYEVHVKIFNQRDLVLMSGLAEQEHALYIEQQIERHLGIADTAVPGEVQRC